MLLLNRHELFIGKSTFWDGRLFNAWMDGITLLNDSWVVETILSVVKGFAVVHFFLISLILWISEDILAFLSDDSAVGGVVVQFFLISRIFLMIADIWGFFFLGSQEAWSTGYWKSAAGLAIFTTLDAAWRCSGDRTRDRDRILWENRYYFRKKVAVKVSLRNENIMTYFITYLVERKLGDEALEDFLHCARTAHWL